MYGGRIVSGIAKQLKSALGGKGSLALLKVIYAGTKHHCDICGARTRVLFDQGYPNPTLYRMQIVGGVPRRADECPVCRSNSRMRLMMLYLRRYTDIFEGPKDILHMAPERGAVMNLAPIHGERYVCADLEPDRYFDLHPVRTADLCALDFEDQSFDYVICNHVLEHVPDDRKAMSEILRVLRPGGVAILQVPIARRLKKTLENEPVASDADRTRVYGQHDHVRLYAEADYLSRLTETGFEVEAWDAGEVDPEAACEADLDPFEKLYVCRRPGAPETQ